MKPFYAIFMNKLLLTLLALAVVGPALATPKPPTPNFQQQEVASEKEYAVATFAGGCFWCMEPPFDKLKGVVKTVSGYTGGHVENPTYKQVTNGGTGHYEVVQVTYDPTVVNYKTLLFTFWRNIDPLDRDGQFCDKGPQYKSAIFYHNKEQLLEAQSSLETLEATKNFKRKVATKIMPAKPFYEAEEYHQDYYQKNPVRYKYYRWGCKRDKRLEELWGSAEE